ncbi:MAG TPA: GNAT family N-acetyltransferase [Thermoanaerobaculia bacterium]|nr:GNAT family N-acetyltransferase [Thermoanaerobaculia bacterium]
MEIRSLRESDDRSRFESGDPDLDRFFRQYPGQNQFRHHLGVTYVAVAADTLAGFATVAPGQLEIDNLPATVRTKLPRYPIPVLRLARLAVDRSVQGQGVGRQLLRFVLQLALRMSDEFGCAGVIVDAKPGAVAFYAGYGFIATDPVEGASDARPRPLPMFLSTRVIRTAVGR